MSGSAAKRVARSIQAVTGWSYTRALTYMREHESEAKDFAAEEGVPARDAVVQMAAAEVEDCGCGGQSGFMASGAYCACPVGQSRERRGQRQRSES